MPGGTDEKCAECKHKLWMHHGRDPELSGPPCSGGANGRNCQCALHGPAPIPPREIDSYTVQQLVVVTKRTLRAVGVLELWLTSPNAVPPRAEARQAYTMLLSLTAALQQLRDGRRIPQPIHDETLGISRDTLTREARRLSQVRTIDSYVGRV